MPELKRMMEIVIQKVDGMASDVRTNTFSIDRLENKIDNLEGRFDNLEKRFDTLANDLGTVKTDVKTLTGQFAFVTNMVMDDHDRIDGLELRVDTLEQKPQ